MLDIPQFVAQGRIESRRWLPSFLYLGDQEYVGVYAREQGALVPTKSVHSAKSWLSNPEVDRTAKILPWDAQEAGRVLSPVEVSTKILKHLADAWAEQQGSPLSEHNVVLTVPASFDEEARELTVMAAREAGIENLTLLEEPAAAFYSWIANDLARSQKHLFDGQTVLVCDVGGGTSDFTSDPRLARRRPHRFHPHRRRQAPAARRRQSRPHARLAGRSQARANLFRSASAAVCAASAPPPRSSCSPIRI